MTTKPLLILLVLGLAGCGKSKQYDQSIHPQAVVHLGKWVKRPDPNNGFLVKDLYVMNDSSVCGEVWLVFDDSDEYEAWVHGRPAGDWMTREAARKAVEKKCQ